MFNTARSAIMGRAIVILGIALCVTLFAQETVFLSDYFPVDQKTYCRKYYQQTIGGNGGAPMVSEVIGEITVPYASGPLTGSLLCGMAGSSDLTAWYSDRKTLINILEGSEYNTGDCGLIEPGARLENFADGQLLNLSTLGGCYQIPKHLSVIDCTQSGACDENWLFQIQDVIVQGITYPEALLIWFLDFGSAWFQLDPQLSDFGIIPPGGGETGNMGVNGLIVLVKDVGPVLNGGFEFDDLNEMLMLTTLWELVDVSCDEPVYNAFDVPANMITQAWGGNDKGDVVGRYRKKRQQAPFKGFLRKKGKITTIEVTGARWTQAIDINNVGDIVGVYRDAFGVQHGFLLEKDNFTTIDFPGAVRTNARGINEQGDIVGIYLDANNFWHGFLLEKDNFTAIDFLPGATQTFANGISNQGHIVGNYRGLDGNTHGFLLKKNNFTIIDNPCGLEERFRDINNRGHIIGFFIDPDGDYGFTVVY